VDLLHAFDPYIAQKRQTQTATDDEANSHRCSGYVVMSYACFEWTYACLLESL